MLATVLSLVLATHFSREVAYSGLNKLKVTIRINGERELLTTHTYGIGDEAIMAIIRGGLFFVPFLLHLGFKYHILEFLHTDAPLKTFFFGQHHFPLFPWSGFFLYGVLLLCLRKSIRGLWAAILLNGGAAILTIFIFKIPLTKTNMSLSYMALALLVVTGVFALFVFLQNHVHRPIIRFIQNNFSLLGRNSLMFLYVQLRRIFRLFLKKS